MDVALISTIRQLRGIHHFGFKVESVKGIEEAALQAVRESLGLLAIYREGVAEAMERFPPA